MDKLKQQRPIVCQNRSVETGFTKKGCINMLGEHNALLAVQTDGTNEFL